MKAGIPKVSILYGRRDCTKYGVQRNTTVKANVSARMAISICTIIIIGELCVHGFASKFVHMCASMCTCNNFGELCEFASEVLNNRY